MKKLLSILAGLAMTATTATTVVSCSWGCSSDKSGDKDLVVPDEKTGDVATEREWTIDEDIDPSQVNEKYKVYDNNGNEVKGASITVEGTTDNPLQKGKTYKFKISYNVSEYGKPSYEGLNKKTYTVNKVKDGSKDGDPVAKMDIAANGHDPMKDPNFVGWIGDDKGVAKMGDTKLDKGLVSDGKGNYEGYEKGKDAKVSVNAQGYPVDSDGDSLSNNGFGKRIVPATIDADGKMTPATAPCDVLGDSDKSKVYLDNDGYRIAYDKENKKWIRVSADGTHKLGSNSEPNSGTKSVWDVNKGTEATENGLPTSVDPNVAPYVQRDASGKVINYLNKDGMPIDVSGDAKSNPNYGKPISNAKTVDSEQNEYKNSNQPGAENADKTYDTKPTQSWTLNGSAELKIGSDVAKNDTIVVGEMDKDGKPEAGKSIVLDPSDPSSYDYKTIPDGKYKGMQVKISKDSNKVEFRWPVSDKQISDIINKNDGNDSPITVDESGNKEIKLPIKVAAGKDPNAKAVDDAPTSAKITTPWDDDSEKPAWWISADSTDMNLDLDDTVFSTTEPTKTVKVFISKTLADSLKDKLPNAPELTGESNAINFAWVTDESGKSVKVVTDDSGTYLEGNIFAILKPEDYEKEMKSTSISFENSFSDATQISGTYKSSTVSYTSVDGSINFKEDGKVNINDENNAVFTIDKNSSSDVNYNQKPVIKYRVGDDGDFTETVPDSVVDAKWDGNNRIFSTKYKDGSLSFNEHISFQLTFNVGHSNPPKLQISKVLVATKKTPTKAEANVDFANGGEAKLNGYEAEWDTNNIGALIDTKSTPSVTVTASDTSFNLKQEDLDATWKDGKLIAKFDEIPMDKYNVTISFNYLNGFKGTKDFDNLSIVKNKEKDITIAQGDSKEISFRTDATLSLNIVGNQTDFDYKNVKSSEVKIDGLTEGKGADYMVSYDNTNAVLKISLNHEIAKQTDKLLATVVLTDDKGNIANPQVIKIAKENAATIWSTPTWEKDAETFDEKTVEFKLKDGTDKFKDIDYTSFKLDNLVGSDPKNKNKTLTVDKDFTYNFDNNSGVLSITLKDEKYKDNYDFKGKFNLANGYDGTREMANATAEKVNPLSTDFDISVDVVVDNGVALDSLDKNAHAKFNVTTKSPKNIDLDKGEGVTASLADKTLGDRINSKYDAKTHQIEVWLKDGAEIPGGKANDLFATFKATNADFGYEDATAKSSYFSVYKTIPNPDEYKNIKWTQNTSDLVNQNSVSFSLDKGQGSEDISLDKLKSIKQKDDSGNWVDLSTNGTTYEYKDGVLKIIYTDEIWEKTNWAKTARQYQVSFGIGNGYEKWGDENFPGGFQAPTLTVTKKTPSDYEKAIDFKSSDAGDISESNKAIWHVNNFGPAISLDKANIKIKSIDNETTATGPIDPTTIKVSQEDGSVTDPGSPKKADKYSQFNIENVANNSGDIEIDYEEGALWKGTYKVVLEFSLTGYPEIVTKELTFEKNHPSKSEMYISPAEDDTISVVKKRVWKGGKVVGVWVYYAEATITFDHFGADVDYTDPTITVGKATSHWLPISKTTSGGKTTLVFQDWKVIDLIGELFGSKAHFHVEFGVSGFPGEKPSVDLVSN